MGTKFLDNVYKKLENATRMHIMTEKEDRYDVEEEVRIGWISRVRRFLYQNKLIGKDFDDIEDISSNTYIIWLGNTPMPITKMWITGSLENLKPSVKWKLFKIAKITASKVIPRLPINKEISKRCKKHEVLTNIDERWNKPVLLLIIGKDGSIENYVRSEEFLGTNKTSNLIIARINDIPVYISVEKDGKRRNLSSKSFEISRKWKMLIPILREGDMIVAIEVSGTRIDVCYN